MKNKGAKNLTFTQRLQIETLSNAKILVKEIAKQLGLHISTVYKELKKGEYEHRFKSNNFWYGEKTYTKTRYSAQIAQDKYEFACTNKGRNLKIDKDYSFVKYMEKRVNEDKISPCAVLGEIKYKQLPFTSISKTTLYRYISLGIFSNIKVGERKKKYKKTIIKRAPRGTSIEKRPKEVLERSTFGHWEMDCVCGSDKTSLLVLSERMTRKEIIFKMKDQKADSVIRCLDTLERRFGALFRKIFKSITVDNGSEFANYIDMEKSCYRNNDKRTSIYYCHPYCSSERGTNERLNREIRRIIPKGSALSKYSRNQIQKVEDWINNYPREIFGYSTSQEKFNNQILNLS